MSSVKVKESYCLHCPSDGLPCRGEACHNFYPAQLTVCDRCGELVDHMGYEEIDGEDICYYCMKEET